MWEKTNSALIVFAAVFALGLGGCERGRVSAPDTGEPVDRTGQQIGQEEDERVVEEQLRPAEEQQAGEIGQIEAEEDETEVQVRRRVVTTELEDVSIPTVSICEEHADLNRMEPEHFAALGVQQSDAQGIVQYREKRGEFQSTEQLDQVPGLSQEAISRLKEVAEVHPDRAEQQN